MGYFRIERGGGKSTNVRLYTKIKEAPNENRGNLG